MIEPATIADKLLVAALELETAGVKPFTAEDLVVAAWKSFPDTFGLLGYHDEEGKLKYPDSNRVLSAIMGSKPLRKRGLLKRVGEKRYELTESGASFAARFTTDLTQGTRPGKTHRAGLAREERMKLRRLLESRAWRKYTAPDRESITFHDACGFWGISPRSNANQLASRVKNIEAILARAQVEAEEASLTLEHGGHPITSQDLEELQNLNTYLMEGFEESLDVIRGRDDWSK